MASQPGPSIFPTPTGNLPPLGTPAPPPVSPAGVPGLDTVQVSNGLGIDPIGNQFPTDPNNGGEIEDRGRQKMIITGLISGAIAGGLYGVTNAAKIWPIATIGALAGYQYWRTQRASGNGKIYPGYTLANAAGTVVAYSLLKKKKKKKKNGADQLFGADF